MGRIGRCVLALIALLAISGGSPSAVYACLPYTILQEPDGFHLAQGLSWAASAVVVEEIENPEFANRPNAVILRIGETIVGERSIEKLRIDQDDGCDGFWYRKGDHVIAAIGRTQRVRPHFDGITNYAVAVWVIRDDGRVDGRIAVPMINGRTPSTETQLRALLAGLPDTATDDPPDDASREWFVVVLSVAALIGATAAWRRTARSGVLPVDHQAVL